MRAVLAAPRLGSTPSCRVPRPGLRAEKQLAFLRWWAGLRLVKEKRAPAPVIQTGGEAMRLDDVSALAAAVMDYEEPGVEHERKKKSAQGGSDEEANNVKRWNNRKAAMPWAAAEALQVLEAAGAAPPANAN